MWNAKVLGAAVLTAVLARTGVALAGRPLAIDDADPVDPGRFEFEAGVSHVQCPHCRHWEAPFGLTYGLFPSIEIGAGFGGQFERRAEIGGETCHVSGICDLIVAAKWQLVAETSWCPAQALVPCVKFPTADDGKELGSGESDYDLTWVASKSLGERSGAHINAGYSWIGRPEGEEAGDILHYGLALDYQLNAPLQLVGEIFADKELENGTDTAVQYNTGLRWNPAANLTLDIAAGSRLSGDAPDFTATAGLTWAFGFAKQGSG